MKNVVKVAIVVADACGGAIVTRVAIDTLPPNLKLPWVLLNVWLWCFAPPLLLIAKNKEDEKND